MQLKQLHFTRQLDPPGEVGDRPWNIAELWTCMVMAHCATFCGYAGWRLMSSMRTFTLRDRSCQNVKAVHTIRTAMQLIHCVKSDQAGRPAAREIEKSRDLGHEP